jgi:hypothetical protein
VCFPESDHPTKTGEGKTLRIYRQGSSVPLEHYASIAYLTRPTSPNGLTVDQLIEAPSETIYEQVSRAVAENYKKAYDDAVDFAIVNGYDPTGMIG